MAAVEVTIPRMLADLVGGARRHTADGETVGEVVVAVTRRHPQLAVHVFDESGGVREHVSVFHNERMADLTAVVGEGDRVVILQAVSGGALDQGAGGGSMNSIWV